MDKPQVCPFCGGVAFSYGIEQHTHYLAQWMPDHEGSGFVECPGCGAAVAVGRVSIWNRSE